MAPQNMDIGCVVRGAEALSLSGFSAIYECIFRAGLRAGEAVEAAKGSLGGAFGLKSVRVVGSEAIGERYRVATLLINGLRGRLILRDGYARRLIIPLRPRDLELYGLAIKEANEQPVLPTAPRDPAGGLPPGQRWVDRFVIYGVEGISRLSPSAWSLSVEGMVEKAVKLSYESLVEIGLSRIKADFHCVTGWSVKDLTWEGVSLQRIAEHVGVKDGATWASVWSADGYSASIPVGDLLGEYSLLALRLNGRPLSRLQGGPVRLVIPHLYGWKNVKWVSKIIFTDRYVDGYWEALGYHFRGNVWLEERFK